MAYTSKFFNLTLQHMIARSTSFNSLLLMYKRKTNRNLQKLITSERLY